MGDLNFRNNGWRNEYFKDLLNPTNMPSLVEEELENSSITRAVVTEVVQKTNQG